MKRLVFLLLLVGGFASAQTQWEYAEYKFTVTQSELFPETSYVLSYPRELIGADTWESFKKLLGFPETERQHPLSVLNLLGRQGYELMGYGTATWRNVLDSEVTERTWYFKRPLK